MFLRPMETPAFLMVMVSAKLEIWYVPAFKDTRLISVGALAKDGINVTVDNWTATARRKTIIFKAPLCNDLYQLTEESLQPCTKSQQSLAAHQSGSTAKISIPNDEMYRVPTNDAELWHFRLAHASYNRIARLPNITKKPKAISKGENAREACLAGKMKETFSEKADDRIVQPARRLLSE
ncbi:hypothetical protein K3495_g374 [Podosphaera aphanis]|nr:hypothetical protein K3495_g374 [Podosphaera aphanis]